MAAPDTDLAPRKFGRTDAARSTITLVVLAITFAAWMFLLPLIQSAIIPTASGGPAGPWVVRPIFATRFGAGISFWFAGGLIEVFKAKLFLPGTPLTPPFFVAVLIGAFGWVIFATRPRLA